MRPPPFDKNPSGPFEHLEVQDLAVAGAKLYTLKPFVDGRGYFARIFCFSEFGFDAAQINLSGTLKKDTLRGMHYQANQAKLVRCTAGAVYDVILDVRKDSPSFGQWCAAELSAKNKLALYVPEGVAHGFITTKDNSELLYVYSAFYEPALQKGIRYNDPAFNIWWVGNAKNISTQDETWPLWTNT